MKPASVPYQALPAALHALGPGPAPGFITIVLLMAAMLLAGPVQSPRAQTPAQHAPLPLYEGAVDGTLASGVRYLLARHPRPTNGLSLRLIVAAGTLHEAEGERGYAHFIEHLAFGPAASLAGLKPTEFFSQRGAILGPDLNAATTPGHTVYRLDLPDASRANIEAAIGWFAEVSARLSFEPDLIRAEAAVITAELAARAGPNLRGMEAEVRFLAPASRFNGRVSSGEIESVAAATPDGLAAFYRRWYRPQAVQLVAVGTFDTDHLLAQLDRHFGAVVEGPDGEAIAPPPVLDLGTDAPIGPGGSALEGPAGNNAAVLVHLDNDLTVASTRIRVLEPNPRPADNRARRVHRLRLRMIHDALTRRLRTLKSSVNSKHLDGVSAIGQMVPGYDSAVTAVTGPAGRWVDTVRLAEQELRRMVSHGLTRTEVEAQRRRMVAAFEQIANAFAGVDSKEVAELAVDRLLAGEVFTDPETELELAREAASAFDQALAIQLTRALWGKARWHIMVAAPPRSVDGPTGLVLSSSSARQVIRESQAVALEAPEDLETRTFAYERIGPPAEPVERSAIANLGVLRLRYANGVVVNLVPTDFQRQAILIKLRVGHGAASVPAGKEHLLALANQSLIAGGLEAHPLSEVANLFAGKAVGARFRAAFDAFEFNASTVAHDFQDQLSVLSAFLVAPGFRPEAMANAAREIEAMREKAAANISGVVGTSVSTFLRGGDPRFALPARAIEPADAGLLRDWLGPQLRHGEVELNIVGDLLPLEAIKALNETFGALPARQGIPAPDETRFRLRAPDAGSAARFEVTGDSENALNMMVWVVPDRTDAQRALAFEVLTTLYDEALRARLREELGLAYEYYSAYQTVPGAGADGIGLLTVQATTRAGDLEAVHTAMVELTNAFAAPDGAAIERAFARSRPSELARFRRRLEHNQFWLSAVAGSTRNAAKLDWIEAVRRLDQLEWQQLHDLATRFLQPDEAIRVIVGPR